MTLQQIKYVLGIADAGSLNKAAERLYVAQPSLTSTIHALEDELNITIFNRTSKGITLTNDGREFVANVRQLYQNYESIIEKYGELEPRKKKFGVSTQHYSFALKSFVEMVKSFNIDEYDFAIRETKTREVIEDVANLKSELGILYLSDYNRNFIQKFLKARELEFIHLIDCKAYVYIWKNHPLAQNKSISFEELKDYPCLSFEQGDEGSFYFSEEILNENEYLRTIKANDRASMLNLMVGLNGYTLCSGIISEELNGSDYIAVPFRETDENKNRIMEIGYIKHKNLSLGKIGQKYVEELKRYLKVL